MINAISGYSPYSAYAAYGASYAGRAVQTPDQAQAAQRSGLVMAAQKVHQPEAPVQPVTPVKALNAQEDPAQAGLLRFGSDPAEMAVRMRIQYPSEQAQGAQLANARQGQAPAQDGAKALSGQVEDPALSETKSPQEVMEEGECQTCKERKYQDGSDDPGVSFKTPTNIAPDQAAAAVRGHENEHVVREQAKAQREDRKVVSQSVTLHTDICPECGKTYISGGTTRTVTKAADSQQADQRQDQQQDPRAPFSAVA